MTDPLEILDAIDRERGEGFIGMIQANQVQRLRDEIVALRRVLSLDPEFRTLVRDMREAQKEYFRQRNRDVLVRSKQLEKLVDAALKEPENFDWAALAKLRKESA